MVGLRGVNSHDVSSVSLQTFGQQEPPLRSSCGLPVPASFRFSKWQFGVRRGFGVDNGVGWDSRRAGRELSPAVGRRMAAAAIRVFLTSVGSLGAFCFRTS